MAKISIEGIISSPEFLIEDSNIRAGDLSSADIEQRLRSVNFDQSLYNARGYKAIVVAYKDDPAASYLRSRGAEFLFGNEASFTNTAPDWLSQVRVWANQGNAREIEERLDFVDQMPTSRTLEQAITQARDINSVTLKVYIFDIDADLPIPVFSEDNSVREQNIYRDCELFAKYGKRLEHPPIGSLIMVDFINRRQKLGCVVKGIICKDKTFARSVLQELRGSPSEIRRQNITNEGVSKINALRERGWWDEIEGDTLPVDSLCDINEEIHLLNQKFIDECNSEYQGLTSGLTYQRNRTDDYGLSRETPSRWATIPNTGFKGIFPLLTQYPNGESLLNTRQAWMNRGYQLGTGLNHAGLDFGVRGGTIVNSMGQYMYTDVPVRAMADGTVVDVNLWNGKLHAVNILSGWRLKGPSWTGGSDSGGAVQNSIKGYKEYKDSTLKAAAQAKFNFTDPITFWSRNKNNADVLDWLNENSDGRGFNTSNISNHVIISHGKYDCIEHQSRYQHLSFDPGLRVGDKVQQGQIIGYVGNTGYSTGHHLHLDFYQEDRQGPASVSDPSAIGELEQRNPTHFFGDWNGTNEYDDSWFSGLKNYVDNTTGGSAIRWRGELEDIYRTITVGDTTDRIINQVRSGANNNTLKENLELLLQNLQNKSNSEKSAFYLTVFASNNDQSAVLLAFASLLNIPDFQGVPNGERFNIGLGLTGKTVIREEPEIHHYDPEEVTVQTRAGPKSGYNDGGEFDL